MLKMTLKHYFIAHAPEVSERFKKENRKYVEQKVIAMWRISFADAMVRELYGHKKSTNQH